MMTAVFAGILVLAGAAWTWSRLAAISVPVSEWIMPVRQVTGALSPEQEVTLFKGADQVGTAMVSSFVSEGASTATVRLKSMNLGPGRIPLDAERIRVGDAASPAFFGVIEAREAVYLFERVYIQASAAAIFVIIGGLLIYRFVGARPSTVDFLIATDGEMKKVNWSTRKIVQDSTVVVIVATFLIAAFVFSSDFLLSGFFRLIGVLHD
ncbi:MAG: preprotein translocase subunit SecE [Phycisphaeraceae bacterium]|nr:preprotein translocase subunit SecE [Phycisphaeraceae bacterium]